MSQQAVKARVRYLQPSNQPPVYYASRAGVADDHDIGIQFDTREVEIRNARLLEPPATLDQQGFSLQPHDLALPDFYAHQPPWPDYEKQIIELVTRVTGADDALVFDHTLRSDSSTLRGERRTREPAGFVHNDYTDDSARRRLIEQLPPAESELRLQGRYAIINVWRSIAGTVKKSPVACCDAQTVEPGDLVAVERRAEERIGELEFATWRPGHQWYYYPDMQANEVLLIKTFDSARDGRATRAIHSSFENPLAPDEAPPRESLESRLLVFFSEPR